MHLFSVEFNFNDLSSVRNSAKITDGAVNFVYPVRNIAIFTDAPKQSPTPRASFAPYRPEVCPKKGFLIEKPRTSGEFCPFLARGTNTLPCQQSITVGKVSFISNVFHKFAFNLILRP